MKKIILMFVVLITSIANAQTFEFECDAPTVESDLSAIYADGTTPPVLTDLINNTSDTVEASTNSSDFFKSLGADSGHTVVSFSSDPTGFYFRIDAIGAPKIYSEVGDINTPASHRAFTLQIVKHIWDLLYPDYDPAAAAFASELEAIYGADTLPTEFVSGGAIETEALAQEGSFAPAVQTFLEKLSSENNTVFTLSNIPPINVGIVTEDGFHDVPSPYTTLTVSLHSGEQIRDWALDIVQAIWILEHPDYVDTSTVEGAIIAMYAAANPPTSLADVINTAASVAYGDSNIVRRLFASKFDNYDLTLNSFGDNGTSFTAVYANNDIPDVEAPGGNSSLSEANFKLWMLEIAKAIWHYGHPEYIDYSVIRANRIAEITALDNASANVVITIVQVENQGEAFRISADPNIEIDFATGIFETGVTSFGRLGYTQWADMKQRITAKINEIDAAAELAALRTTRINELKGLGITGVSIAHVSQSNGNDSFSVTRPGDQIVINADWYGPGLVQNHDDEEFDDLRDAIIAAREELNPANAIYGFTPAQFQIASPGERLTKAYDIAQANRDIAAVDGSLNKEIEADKVTLRVGAKNYPFEVKPELLNTADYEGWKTFINRILYLVKTGDGSERTTRENHINGIAGNISVQDLDGGDDDWAVSWNDLPFIYGGSDENDHDTSYDTHGNTSRVFAGYHQDNIGLLPGVVYEALLVEVHRINGYVIAADALRRHADMGYNKEREMGIKALLTGNASFHENANAEWFILNSDVTVWTNSKYGPICDVPGYLWLGVMDNYSFRYMYIIIRNELIRNDDGIRYYNNVNQNIYCN